MTAADRRLAAWVLSATAIAIASAAAGLGIDAGLAAAGAGWPAWAAGSLAGLAAYSAGACRLWARYIAGGVVTSRRRGVQASGPTSGVCVRARTHARDGRGGAGGAR